MTRESLPYLKIAAGRVVNISGTRGRGPRSVVMSGQSISSRCRPKALATNSDRSVSP